MSRGGEGVPEQRRVVVIGLDGATFDILDPLAQKGKLPNLSRMMSQGFRSVLVSTVPPVSAPAWSTFITGKNPGKHGILQFVALGPEQAPQGEGLEIFPGGFTVINAKSIRGRSLWRMISEANKSVGVINVPMTYPPSEVNGFMITGMLTPPGAAHFTYPEQLAQSLGDYEVELSLQEREFSFDPDLLIDRLFEVSENRAATSLRLMQEMEWDFFMVVFTETDRIQHRFWRCLDPRDPAFESSWSRRYRGRLEEYFERLDAMVGQLMDEAAKRGAVTIVLSDHGFGPAPSKVIRKRVLLEELGLSETGSSAWIVRLLSFMQRSLGLNRDKVYRSLGRIVPRALLSKVESRVRQAERDSWARDKGYIVNLGGFIGGITINVKDVGRMESSKKQKDLCAEIVAKLRALRDPETGQSIITTVHRAEELYRGALVNEMPDLIFFTPTDYALAGGTGRTGNLVEASVDDPKKQGTHRLEGILLISGPNVRRMDFAGHCGLEDVTPTILYLLDIPIPADIDGRVVRQAFQPDFVEANPVQLCHPETIGEVEEHGAPSVPWESEEDMESIRERLKGIGYLD